MKELRCPQCGCTNIQTERRPNGLHRCLFCFRSWTNGATAVAGVNGFSFGPTAEDFSVVGIPIESQKPPFQEEPFSGYIDSLKARIDELEATVQEACSFLTTASLYFSGDEWYLREIEKFVAKHDEVNQEYFIEKYTKGKP